MKGSYYLLLIFPIIILFAGFMVLSQNLYAADSQLTSPTTINLKVSSNQTIQKEQAMPYFILASVLVILILALPRLQEFSVSRQSLVIKLFEEVKEAADNLDEETHLIGAEALRTGISKEKVRILQDRINTLNKLLSKSK